MSSGIQFVILGLLQKGPLSGYDVKQIVDSSTRFFWAASYGQIYPELRRLEEQGLVTGSSKPQGGRARRLYRLTPAGRKALRAWLREPSAGMEVRNEALLKLFMADALPRKELPAVVAALRADSEEVLARLAEVRERVDPDPDETAKGLVLEFGIGFHRWIVNWCRAQESRLERGTR